MSSPLRWAYGNLLFGHRDERAALYRIDTISYPFLPEREKEVWLARLVRFAFQVEADFSLWRVNRVYNGESYVSEAEAMLDERYADRGTWVDYLTGHEEHLAETRAHLPELYLAVSLRAGPPSKLGASVLRGADQARRRIEGLFGVGQTEPIARRELDLLLAAEERTLARLLQTLPARRATTQELQWLLRRAACRGVAEPAIDAHWEPNALVLDDEDGEARYEPLETDIVRMANAPILEEERSLVVDAEEARSHQAMLCLGALPETATFPGSRAELLFAPLEGVEFPVDCALHARWIGNRAAVSQVKRKINEVDNIYAEQEEGQQGATWQADEDRTLARELDLLLQGEERPPLLRASIGLAVGATSAEELDERVELLKGQYGTIELHRPLGLQPALFRDHLPQAAGGQVTDYADYLTIEQFGALMPLGDHRVGAKGGVYLGETTGGAGTPVFFDVTEASREGRPPTILLAGTLGSGKTIASELIAFGAERRGSTVVNVDPKPDHALDQVPELEGRVDVIELTGEERYRGLLDPLRIAPPSLREDLTTTYLMDLLPAGSDPTWETQIRKAVRQVIGEDARSSLEVLAVLQRGENPEARKAFDALEVWADSGLGRLAFAPDGRREAVEVERAVTTIRANGLTLPDAQASPHDYDSGERLSVATLKLVANYAMRLASDPDRHSVVLFDEAWALLSTAAGRRLANRLARLGRSQNATLILATQQLGDVGELEGLVGTRMIFGLETTREAKTALELLSLDPEDEVLVERVRSYRRGMCLMRDIEGRCGEVQIDPVYGDLLDALDTTPRRREADDSAELEAAPA